VVSATPAGGSGARRRLGWGREAEIFAYDDGRALRLLRDRDGRDRLEQEAAAMTAAHRAGVAVPAVHEVMVVDGRPGLVMDLVDGTDLMTGLARRPWRVPFAARALGRLQAQLHDVVAPPELPALRAMLSDRLDAAPGLSASQRGFARGLLDELPDGDRICHGDFHPGNVIFSSSGPVLIDWANATRGDAAADLGRTVLLLRVGAIPGDLSPLARAADRLGRDFFRRRWVRSYQHARPIDLTQVRRWESVCAAARLAEGITEEVGPLLALIDERAGEPV
jgi:aminoglycoside phosphotransferase (APT) family kinase protein